MSEESVALMSKLRDLFSDISHRLDWFFPWCVHLDNGERQAFLIDLLQAVHTQDAQQLQTVVQEWQATAEALGNPEFMKAWRGSDNPDDYVPWEQGRGGLNISGETEEGR